MVDNTMVRDAVNERSRAFERAFSEGVIEQLVDDYFVADNEKPCAFPPAQPPVIGRAALVEMFTGMRAETLAVRLETVDLTPSDSVAYEVGRAHLTLADGSQAIGRYAICWMASDTGWRVKTDFFTTDGWQD